MFPPQLQRASSVLTVLIVAFLGCYGLCSQHTPGILAVHGIASSPYQQLLMELLDNKC